MEDDHAIAVALITLGAILLAGLATDLVGRRTRLPRVTLLLLLGVVVGPLGLDFLPGAQSEWLPFVGDLALVMVAFLLGGELTTKLFRAHGRTVLVASAVIVVATAAVVAGGLLALGWPLSVALVLGAVATSTDPMAVSDVVREEKKRTFFSKTLLGIVAVDDAWGIVAMSVMLATVLAFERPEQASSVALEGFVDLGGAVLLGAVLAFPMVLLSGRVRAGEPTQAEALGGVLLCGGIALWFGVSFLLSAMTMGVIVANLAHHHRRPFRAIEGIEWPFMVVFFVLSGASLHMESLGPAASLAIAYVALRVVGRLAGGWLGVAISGDRVARGIGIALFPQAGVAIGMALVASQRLPGLGSVVLSATVAATIVFELFGPILTRVALVRADTASAPRD